MRLVIMAIVSFALAGCASATVVNHPGRSGTENGPKNEQVRPGLIKYNMGGLSGIVESRRADACKKMKQECGGDYNILSEGPNAEGGQFLQAGYSVAYVQNQFWYITFQCAN